MTYSIAARDRQTGLAAEAGAEQGLSMLPGVSDRQRPGDDASLPGLSPAAAPLS